MAFNNAVDAKQQGTQYLSTAGAWSGLDGGVAGRILTSNGTGVAPSFQASGASVASLSPYIVGTTGTNDFTTIQAAINAAGAGPATIYIKTGGYTENLTISTAGAFINLYSFDTSTTPSPATSSLLGNITISGQGALVTIQGLFISTSGGANAINISSAVSCDLTVENSYITVANGGNGISCAAAITLNLSVYDSSIQATGDGIILNDANLDANVFSLNSNISSININNSAITVLNIDGTNNGFFPLIGKLTLNSTISVDALISNSFLFPDSTVPAIVSTNTAGLTVEVVNSIIDIGAGGTTGISCPNINTGSGTLNILDCRLGFDLNAINFPSNQFISNCTPYNDSGSGIQPAFGTTLSRHFAQADNLGLSQIGCYSAINLLKTTNATPSTIFFFTLSANESVSFFAEVSAVKSDYSLQFSSTLIAGARKAGGAAALVGTPVAVPVKDVTFTGSITAVVVGDDLIIQVTGIAATTIEWQSLVRYQTL